MTSSLETALRRRCFTLSAITTITSVASMSILSSSSSSNLPARRDTCFDVLKRFDRLRTNVDPVLLLDGGTGEELFRLGVPDDRKLWSATAVVHSQHHQVLQQVHDSFLKAGADAITTNSFGVVPGVGFEANDIVKYVTIAGQIARRSADSAISDSSDDCTSTHSTTYPPLVFGSLGPLVESYRADLIMEHDRGVPVYKEISQALLPYVDIYLAETMSCIDESIQVVEALSQLSSSLFPKRLDQTSNSELGFGESHHNRQPLLLMISYTLDSNGNFRNGQGIEEGIEQLLDIVMTNKQYKSIRLLGVLFNCCEPEAITTALQRLHANTNLRGRLTEENDGIVLGAYANRLTPVDPNWTLADSEMPQPMRNDLNEKDYWEKFVKFWIDEYQVKIIGGCCGITPEHISHIRSHLEKQ